MVKLFSLKFLILASVLVSGGVLASCANPPPPTDVSAPPVAVQDSASNGPSGLDYQADRIATTSYQPSSYLTVNVDITDTGIQQSSVYIPVGQSIMLVLRNRGDHEHHYHISDLVPTDMLWLSREGDLSDIGSQEHSDHNHGGEMVPYHICSPGSGVCPTGNAVHAHAEAGDIDVILFTATNAGTFLAQDPLHPEITGKVIVY